MDGKPISIPIRKIEPVKDCGALAMSMFLHSSAARKIAELSHALELSINSLCALQVGIGWDHAGREFASFPSRNHEGKVIGITRRYAGGIKRTYPGTHNGLFYVNEWNEMPGPLLIVEGATDVAACLSIPIAAIGRPSNTGGFSYLRRMLMRYRSEVIVVGERDRKLDRCCAKNCRGCSWCWPGLYGAKSMSEKLYCSIGLWSKWLLPPAPFKDVRALLIAGELSAWIADLRKIKS